MSINDNFSYEVKPSKGKIDAQGKINAHERSECKQPIFLGLIKCIDHNKLPYKDLYSISGVKKRIFHRMKITLFTMNVYDKSGCLTWGSVFT